MLNNAICIIPARGGSKRIPRKNIKDFCGKPIIAYSIEAALKSNLFDEVMVSTDDAEIAEIAKSYGAKVPFIRSAETSDDYATTADVLVEVLKKYEELNLTFDFTCCLYTTSPLLSHVKLNKGYDILKNQSKDSVIPIVGSSHPVQRSFRVSQNNISYAHPEHEKSRSQDLEKHYHDAGQFYWVKTSVLLSQKSLVTNNTGFVELSELEVQDIDTLTDWKLAELKFNLIHEIS